MRKARTAFLFILIYLFWASFALCQSGYGKGRLSGVVVDDDAKPVAGARIILQLIEMGVKSGFGRRPSTIKDSAVFETVTNEKGVWVFTNLATGIWEIRASKAGYDSANRQVQVLQLSGNPSVKLRLNKIEMETGSFTIAPDLLDQANDYYFRRKFDEALIFYRQYLEKDPESFMVMLAVGDCLREIGNIEEALRTFKAIVVRTEANIADNEILAQALTGLGEVYFIQGDRENAVKCWKLAVDKSDTSEIPAVNLGEIYFSEGKTEEAVHYFTLAITRAPKEAGLHYKLGLVYLNSCNYEKALASFSRVISLQPLSELAKQARKIAEDLGKRRQTRP